MTQPVMIQWSISSFFGWGVYGLNLAMHWSGDPEIEPVCVAPFDAGQIALDPLRERAILPFLVRSVKFQADLSHHANGGASADATGFLGRGASRPGMEKISARFDRSWRDGFAQARSNCHC